MNYEIPLGASQAGNKLMIRVKPTSEVSCVIGWKRGQYIGVVRRPENEFGEYKMPPCLAKISDNKGDNFYLIFNVIGPLGNKRLRIRKIPESRAFSIASMLAGGMTIDEARQKTISSLA